MAEHLCEECSRHLNSVFHYLDELGIAYKLTPRLVRGLDYYTKTAFEIVSTELGSQNSVGGGGRYDGLIAEIGGPPTPAVGFGLGLERILTVMEAQGAELPEEAHPSVFIATLGDAPREVGIKLLADLRKAGVAVETDYAGKSLKAQMKSADREQVLLTVIIGEDELSRGQVKVRNMQTKEETDVPLDRAVEEIRNLTSKRQAS
jgi:histidyl-tRNA synthetase